MQKAVTFRVLENLRDEFISHGRIGFIPTHKTKKNRRIFIDGFLRYLQAGPLTLDSVEGYVLSRQENGAKLNTVKTDAKNVLALCNWLKLKGHLDVTGFAERLKQPRTPRQYRSFYTQQEYEQVILAGTVINDTDNALHRKQKFIAQHALLFILTTGCRVGEALRLTGDDVIFTNNRVEVVFRRKTLDYDKQPVTDKRVAEFLLTIKKKEKVFACTEELLRRVLKRGEKACVLSGGEITPHSLRHGLATDMLRNGCTMPLVSRVLGHSNTKITYETYAHLDSSDVEQALRNHSSLAINHSTKEEVQETLLRTLQRTGYTQNSNVHIHLTPDGGLQISVGTERKA